MSLSRLSTLRKSEEKDKIQPVREDKPSQLEAMRLSKREPENHLKQMLNLEVPGRRPRGKPKGRWRDGITRDMKQLHIEAEDAEDRSFWRKRTQAADLNLGTGASR
ncbi:hypothetical protein PoB_004811400 [Plakobranchus ocellatus]|uniref:Uncharacterized protein n=1 Tax=Plakobranchus ocellatus TaxID=259542 RepID=A0AAV4BRZ8_9GAST|nr:hypothetical protein PoB_004811400 [Plakobranchus ocellatus]